MDVISDAVAAMRAGQPHAARTHCSPPWGLRFPPGDGPGFHVVLRGTCWLLPGADDEPVHLSAGDVILVSADRQVGLADDASSPLELATREMDDAWRSGDLDRGQAESTVLMCGSYRFSRAHEHPLLAELPDIIHLPRHVGQRAQLDAVVDLLGNELNRRQPGTDALLPSLLDAMLIYILRSWHLEEAPTRATGWSAALQNPAVGAALEHLHGDPARAWTVEELARCVGLSRAAFARRFTALVGRPPLDYLTWWRMSIATALIRHDDAPLAVIAQRTGYGSEAAFNRAFKREFGTTPGTYRRTVSAH